MIQAALFGAVAAVAGPIPALRAIDISSPDGFAPLAIATCPPLLKQQGSWCTWFKGNIALSGNFVDTFFANNLGNTGGFTGEANSAGFINPHWIEGPPGPGVFEDGRGLFPRFISSDDDNTLHWTTRPIDSFVTVHTVDLSPDIVYTRADQADMDFGVWNLLQISWNILGGFCSIAINDQPKSVGFEPDPFSGVWNGGQQDQSGAIISNIAAFFLLVGTCERYDYWLTTEVIDWTNVANRRRFINANLEPVQLNANGSSGSPTNRQPEFFFHPENTLADFTNNRGSGGIVRWSTLQHTDDGVFVDPISSSTSGPQSADTGFVQAVAIKPGTLINFGSLVASTIGTISMWIKFYDSNFVFRLFSANRAQAADFVSLRMEIQAGGFLDVAPTGGPFNVSTELRLDSDESPSLPHNRLVVFADQGVIIDTNEKWYHLKWDYDTSAGTASLVVNGVAVAHYTWPGDVYVAPIDNEGSPFTPSFDSFDFFVNSVDALTTYAYAVADVWIDLNHTGIDIDKFVDTNTGRPKDLGLNGEAVTGVSPDFFLHVDSDAHSFLTNRGSGGSGTLTGDEPDLESTYPRYAP